MEKVCNTILRRSILTPYNMIFFTLPSLGAFTSFFIFWIQEVECENNS